MRQAHAFVTKSAIPNYAHEPKFVAADAASQHLLSPPRDRPATRLGFGPAAGSSDPTSPRREASLFNSPASQGPAFFLCACRLACPARRECRAGDEALSGGPTLTDVIVRRD